MSLGMRLVAAYLGSKPKKFASRERLRAHVALGVAPVEPPGWLRRWFTVRREWVRGVAVYRVSPRNPSDVGVIYYHGGAYVNPIGAAHWWLIADLVRRTGATFYVPMYGRAPQHTVADVWPLADELLVRVQSQCPRVVLAGDSAGGGLALAHAMRYRDGGQSRTRPLQAVVMFAPWLDVAVANPRAHRLEKFDCMIAREGAALAGEWWAGTPGTPGTPAAVPLDSPQVSPLYGEIAGLPPLTFIQGGLDMCWPDVAALVSRARAAGQPVRLHFVPQGFHVFVGAVFLRESRVALRVAAREIGKKSTD